METQNSQFTKFTIISEITKAIYNNIPVLIPKLSSQFFYLITAIDNDSICLFDEADAIVQAFRVFLPKEHLVWAYIRIEPEVIAAKDKTTISIPHVRCNLCKHDIPIDEASFSAPLGGWLGTKCCINMTIKDGAA